MVLTWPADFERSPRRVWPVSRAPAVVPAAGEAVSAQRCAVRPRDTGALPPHEPAPQRSIHLSVFELRPMYATDRQTYDRETDVRQTNVR